MMDCCILYSKKGIKHAMPPRVIVPINSTLRTCTHEGLTAEHNRRHDHDGYLIIASPWLALTTCTVTLVSSNQRGGVMFL